MKVIIQPRPSVTIWSTTHVSDIQYMLEVEVNNNSWYQFINHATAVLVTPGKAFLPSQCKPDWTIAVYLDDITDDLEHEQYFFLNDVLEKRDYD